MVAICVLKLILELKVRWFVLALCWSNSKLRNFLVGFLISYRTQTKVLPLDSADFTLSNGMVHVCVRLLCAGEIRPKVVAGESYPKLTLYFLAFLVVAPAGGGRHGRDVYHSIGDLTGYPAVYIACRASLMWAQTYPRLFRVFGRGGRHGCPVQTGYIPFDRKSYGLSNGI